MKTAIVTGSSRGIGAAVLKRLAKDGFAVVVNYLGGPEAAQSVAAEVKAAGGQAITVQADVAQEADVKRLFAETKTTDILASIYGEAARAHVLVLVDEVADGGWGFGDDVLTLEKLKARG